MITNAAGRPITLVAYYGQHLRPNYSKPLGLVQAKLGKKRTEFYFVCDLMADGGIEEIVKTTADLPRQTLIGSELAEAVQSANNPRY